MISGTHRFPRQDSVIYGRPAAAGVVEAARARGRSRALLVTTASLSGPDGPANRLARDLGGLCVGAFAGVTAHSPREGVIAGAAQARAANADLIVAFGGGSVIDAAKVMQICVWAGLHAPAELDRYRADAGRAALANLAPNLAMIAVPTTLSAAEFTPFAGVTDAARRIKDGYTHRDLAPRVVILDPEATLATPPRLWFSTGLKAIDHAVEQICNRERAPFADALAADGLRRLSVGLAATRADPTDLDARLECQFGMWLAISGASAGRGMGASHAIGHTLGGSYGVPHGITSCVALPAVLEWTRAFAGDQQALVATLMGRQGVAASVAVRDLALSLDLPTTLAAVGIGPGDFAAIASHTMHDRGVRSSPRPISAPSDIEEILDLARG
jgi:maleylacetate reductase